MKSRTAVVVLSTIFAMPCLALAEQLHQVSFSQEIKRENRPALTAEQEVVDKISRLADSLSPELRLNEFVKNPAIQDYDPTLSIRVRPAPDRGVDATVQLSIPL